MTDIDWSKAPEGATHYLPEDAKREWAACWYKQDSLGQWFGLNASNHARGVYDEWTVDNDQVQAFTAALIPRPSPQWYGAGLPPVGAAVDCKCTAKSKARDWFPAEVKYISPYTVVLVDYSTDELDGEFVAHPATLILRPRRTPAQIAAEEREAAMKKFAGDIMGHAVGLRLPMSESGAERLAEHLIMDGYAKPKGDDQ